MNNRILAVALIPLLAMASTISAQQKEEHKLVQFQMAILKKGPKWADTKEADRSSIFKQHLANVIAMLDSGKAIIAGPFGDDTDLAGIFILRAKSTEEGKEIGRASCRERVQMTEDMVTVEKRRKHQ